MRKLLCVLLLAVSAVLFFSGTGSVKPFDFPEIFLFPPVPPEVKNAVTVEGAELGRYLFYDPILSRDSTISCSSCHQQKAAFSDPVNVFSVGIEKKKQRRNTPALFNLAWYPYYFFDGRANTLQDQVSHPIRSGNEMDMDWNTLLPKLKKSKFYRAKFSAISGKKEIDSTDVKSALAQFLFTLLSYQSKFDKVMTHKAEFTNEEFRGFGLVNNQTRGDCLHCHPTDGNGLMTTFAFSNNGLDSVMDAKSYMDRGRGDRTGTERDNGKFKIPSLRNVALTAPYMHDGRFKTLEEVIEFYSSGVHFCANIDSKMEFAHQGGARLTAQEKKDILAFLKTLTDSVFIAEEAYRDPFEK